MVQLQVFNQDKERSIKISFCIDEREYGIFLNKDSADIFLDPKIIDMKMETKVSLPYLPHEHFTYTIKPYNGPQNLDNRLSSPYNKVGGQDEKYKR